MLGVLVVGEDVDVGEADEGLPAPELGLVPHELPHEVAAHVERETREAGQHLASLPPLVGPDHQVDVVVPRDEAVVAVDAQQRALRHEVADVEDVEGLGEDEEGVEHLPLLLRRQRGLEVLHLPQVLGGELPPHLLQPGVPVLLRVHRQRLRVDLLQQVQVGPHALAAVGVRGAVDVVEQVEDVDTQQLKGVKVVPGLVPQAGRHQEVAERGDEKDDEGDDGDDLQLGDDLLSREAAGSSEAIAPRHAARGPRSSSTLSTRLSGTGAPLSRPSTSLSGTGAPLSRPSTRLSGTRAPLSGPLRGLLWC